jgi:hypothetical protein
MHINTQNFVDALFLSKTVKDFAGTEIAGMPASNLIHDVNLANGTCTGVW